MNFTNFSFNWFDLAVLVLLLVGVLRGRSRGISEELLDVLKWLLIVVIGGMVYRPGGRFIADFTHVNRATGYVAFYVFVIIAVRFLFAWFKRMVGEKLVGSDAFGGAEYYLGMVAGAVRFACYLLVALAVLNADYISPEQLAAQAKMQRDNFGDISFPTIGTLQQTIFTGSASGRLIKQYLGGELIATVASDERSRLGETIGRQRERAVYEVLGERR